MQRFTISLQDELAEQFDAWIAHRGYENRSEAVRDMLRAELEQDRQRAAQSLHCVANLSYVYRYGERDLVERLARLQHGASRSCRQLPWFCVCQLVQRRAWFSRVFG
jgi:CopG family nickel-responsive transcriptional regulator